MYVCIIQKYRTVKGSATPYLILPIKPHLHTKQPTNHGMQVRYINPFSLYQNIDINKVTKNVFLFRDTNLNI